MFRLTFEWIYSFEHFWPVNYSLLLETENIKIQRLSNLKKKTQQIVIGKQKLTNVNKQTKTAITFKEEKLQLIFVKN